MNWKQFLKPDWRKIILFIIIPSIPAFLSLVESLRSNYLIFPIFHPFFSILVWERNIETLLPTPEGRILDGFFTILDSVYIYIISCLIIWIYDKVKKKF